jgi:hypothetical protein
LLLLDDLFSSPSAVGDHDTTLEGNDHILVQTTSLTGGPNSPPTPPGANDPGLNTPGSKGGSMKKWLWIILGILLIFAGFWYFGSPA